MSVPTKFCLFKRSNGYYYLVYEEDGRRKWKSTGTRLRTEAFRALTDFKSLLKSRFKTPLLSEFRRDFIAFAELNHAKTTRDLFAFSLSILQRLCGDLPLNSYNLRHIDIYKAQRVCVVSPVSVNVEMRALRSAFGYAVRWELLEKNPLSGVSLLRVPARVPAYFTAADFEKLLSVINQGWLKDIVLLSVMTGLRRGEVVNLRWKEVDLERGVLLVQSHESFRTKDGRMRIIPLTDEARALLLAKLGGEGSALVFTRNGEKISEDYLTKIFRIAVSNAELDGRLHFHSLRHTFASWLVQNGAALYEVQVLLGHSNITVTQVYSHLKPEQLHNAVKRLGPIVEGVLR
jgi:site-specific recombinase XerD